MVGVEFADSALGALAGADACILVTEWPEFREIEWAAAADRMAGKLVIDGRNYVDPATVREAGFVYEGIGR
jgi:UDPglucose 6-dehydrogenase